MEKAATVIAAILDGGEDEAVRLRAAQVTVEVGLRAVEVLDVTRRLEALEAALGRKPGRAA